MHSWKGSYLLAILPPMSKYLNSLKISAIFSIFIGLVDSQQLSANSENLASLENLKITASAARDIQKSEGSQCENGFSDNGTESSDRRSQTLPEKGLFSSEQIITLKLSLPIEKTRAKAISNTEQRDGVAVDRSESWVEGTINGKEIKVRARGLTSVNADELDFPKLRIELVDDESGIDDFFTESDKFLMNTEGTIVENRTRTSMRRILGPEAPLREKLVYNFSSTLGILSPLTRVVRLEVTDTTNFKEYFQYALLVESKSQREKRLRAINLSNQDYTALNLPVTQEDAIAIHLLNALVGNRDYSLRALGEELKIPPLNLFNMEVYKMEDGSYKPMAYDFDLALAVKGSNSEEGMHSQIIGMNQAAMKEMSKRYTIEKIKKVYQQFLKQHKQLHQLVYESDINPDGKELFYFHIQTFFSTWNEALIANESQPALTTK